MRIDQDQAADAPPIHLCIGAARTGTTWLFNNLLGRRDIFVPPVKEVRFWFGRRSPEEVAASVRHASRLELSADGQAWLALWSALRDFSGDAYRALMRAEGRPSIDISPIYSIMPQATVEEVVATIPATSKVLYFVRNPLDRFMSQLRLHLYLHGGFRGPAADGSIRAMASRKAQLDRSDYEAVVARWAPLLGDRFRVFDYDGLKRDPRQFLGEVSRFLELDVAAEEDLAKAGTVYGAEARIGGETHIPAFPRAQRSIVAGIIKPTVDDGYTIVPAATTIAWQRAIDAAIDPAPEGRAEEPDSPFTRLMRLTESLGQNCEFGFWQRSRGYEPSSLFRWTITPAPALATFLDRDPGTPLFRRSNLRRHSAGLVHDLANNFKFHSKLPTIAGEADIAKSRDPALLAAYAEEREKIHYLRTKFFSQARRKPALYVMKGKALTLEQVAAVRDRLVALNPLHVLLWVTEGAHDGVEIAGERILSAQIARFAPAIEANKLDGAAWTRTMTRCLGHDWIKQLLRSAIR